MYTSKLLYYTLLQVDDAFGRLLDHVETLPSDLVETEIGEQGYPSIRTQLIHSLQAGNNIMYMLGDREEPSADISEMRGILEFKAAWQALKRRAGGWLLGRSEKELDHFEDFSWPSGRETRMPCGTLFMRMLFHFAHHKGQIAAQCSQLGFPAPNTEITWVQPSGSTTSADASRSEAEE